MIDVIVTNFETFADVYIKILVIAYIFSMALILSLWLKPFVYSPGSAYIPAGVFFVLRFIYYLIPVDSDLLQGISIVIALITFLISWILDHRRNPVQKLFLCILFYVMSFLTYEISVEIGLFETRFVSQFDWYSSNARAIAVEFIIWNLIEYVLAGILMLISMRIILRVYRRKTEELSWKELLILLTPSWTILIVKPIMLAYFRLWMDGIGNGSIKENIPASFYRLGFCILSVISLVVIITLYQNIRESREESYARRALESQTEEMHRHMEQIDETYEKMRAMRHDMGNHMAVIQGLIESGDRDAANDYIGEWRENMNNLEMSVKTGNPFTDVAISGFADRFEETGISFDQSFVYPENLHINPFDLCVVLSNALQNAYEASVNVDDPYVSLTSVLKNNTFIINVRNRIGLEIDIDKETGLPYSSKKEDGHGYGLKNIRNVAQKYNGDIDIRQEHDGHGLIFILNVMMIG